MTREPEGVARLQSMTDSAEVFNANQWYRAAVKALADITTLTATIARLEGEVAVLRADIITAASNHITHDPQDSCYHDYIGYEDSAGEHVWCTKCGHKPPPTTPLASTARQAAGMISQRENNTDAM